MLDEWLVHWLFVCEVGIQNETSNIPPTQSREKGTIWIANLEVIQTSWNTLRAFWSNLISVCLENVFLFYICKITSTRTTYHPDKSYWHFLVLHHQLPQRLLSSFKYWRSLRGNNFKSTKTSGEITFRLADVTEHWRTSAKWINQCYGTLKRLWEIVLNTKQKLIFSFLVQYHI